ncbi:MAG: YbjN domain-containing protein [Pseudomonadota bacterium]|nr:YbjN domain-containing protein [Pseudomonadota bacterium]
MTPSQQRTDIILDDPIELVTRFVVTHDWLLQSRGENAVVVEVPGKWCDYQLAVLWRHDESAMQVKCRIDVQTDPTRYGEMALLATLLNKQIFIGYLGLDVITGELEMRYTLALRGAGGATPEQIEDVVDILLGECEHCYPAIYQVANHNVLATDAAGITMFTTEGKA